MEQGINNALVNGFILAICDKAYCAKANNRSGGVGYEVKQFADFVSNNPQQDKVIPIILDGKENKPFIFTGTMYINLTGLPDLMNEPNQEYLRLKNVILKPRIPKNSLPDTPTVITEDHLVTRKEVAELICHYTGLIPPQDNANKFLDINENDECYESVQALYYNGVVSGYLSNLSRKNDKEVFNPNGYIFRVDAIAMIVNGFALVLASTDSAPNFTDVSLNSPYFDYIEAAYAWRVINPDINGGFRPYDFLDYVEFIDMLGKAMYPVGRNNFKNFP